MVRQAMVRRLSRKKASCCQVKRARRVPRALPAKIFRAIPRAWAAVIPARAFSVLSAAVVVGAIADPVATAAAIHAAAARATIIAAGIIKVTTIALAAK